MSSQAVAKQNRPGLNTSTVQESTENSAMPLPTQPRNRYRILSLLGQGPQGKVYLAEDTYLDRRVALKIISVEHISQADPRTVREALLCFQTEMQILAGLHHPLILPFLDYGQIVVNAKSFVAFAMPLFPEGSLATWLRHRGDLAMPAFHEVSHILSQAADALHHAHQHHLTHLAIKPENLLLRTRAASSLPDTFVAEFGLTRLVASTSTTRPKASGDPLYMAPEQWEGSPVIATDQYALAVIGYFLLTGRTPYVGNQEQLRHQHLHVLPPPPSFFNRHIPAALDTVIQRALAKRPADRFDSVLTFARAFSFAVAPAHFTPQIPVSGAPAISVHKPSSVPNRSLTRVVGMALLLLALLVLVSSIGGSMLWSHAQPAPHPPLQGNEAATAQVATAITLKANPDPYPPYTATLVFSDTMSTDHFNWTTGSTNDATCTFTNGAYLVSGKQRSSVNPCLGSGILFSNYHNFVFEVHMGLIKGTGGGIRFHISSVGSYNFVVYQDKHYTLTSDDSAGDYHALLLQGRLPSSSLAGLQSVNTIAVVASGTRIDLYVNHIRIASTHDSFSSQGSFGLLADQESQVAFSDARLWT